MQPDASGRGILRRTAALPFRPGWGHNHSGFRAGLSAWSDRYSTLRYRSLLVVATGWKLRRGKIERKLNQSSVAPYATPQCNHRSQTTWSDDQGGLSVWRHW